MIGSGGDAKSQGDRGRLDVSERIEEVMSIDGEAPAIWYGGPWWTWNDCRRIGAALGARLEEADLVAAGVQIAIVMRNRPAHVAAILHCLAARACIVPVSSLQEPSGVAADIEALRPAVVMADEEDLSAAVQKSAEAVGALMLPLPPDAHSETRPPARPGAEPRPGTAIWMPTSGTTGPPKRLAITYADLSRAFARVQRYSRSNAGAAAATRLSSGVVVVATPLVHILGLWSVMQFAVEGRRLALLDRFRPHEWADVIEQLCPAVASLPPAALTMLLEAGVAPEKLQSLRAIMCSTAPLAPEVEDRFVTRYGIPVLTTYGATEFPGGLVGWTLEDKKGYGAAKRGSVGRPRPGVQLRVVDHASGEAAPPGTEGLIEVLASGASSGDDRWVRTTDLGRLDEDGFLWVTGRADGAINRGGFKILPETVEVTLGAHPAVRAAAVAGVRDARLGEVPVAAVEVSGSVTEEELMAWARERLLKYQVPARIHVVEELPRTPSWKVSRPRLLTLLGSLGERGGSSDEARPQ